MLISKFHYLKRITNKFTNIGIGKYKSNNFKLNNYKTAPYSQEEMSEKTKNNNDEETSLLSKREKILSKVLLRSVLFYDNKKLKEEEENEFHEKLRNTLNENFKFEEENEPEQDFLTDPDNIDSQIIYGSNKNFYVDWLSSNLSEGKFILKIQTQSKNIIFEDLFTYIKNQQDDSNSFVVKYDREESDTDLLDDNEKIPFNNRFILDYPKEIIEDIPTQKKRYELEYLFDKNKPNQLLNFCEKLLDNKIITSEDYSNIIKLANVTGRNLKYTQNQNIFGNQYEYLNELFSEMRIMEKLERIPEYTNVKVKFDLNLIHFRPDHKINDKVKINFGEDYHFIYVIARPEDFDKYKDIKEVDVCDSGQFFPEFIDLLTSDNFNKKYKILYLSKDSELISANDQYHQIFLQKINDSHYENVKETYEQLIEHAKNIRDNYVQIENGKENSIIIEIGDLSISEQYLIDNFNRTKKTILKNKPKTVRNLIKNISFYIKDTEFRLKNVD